jgi:hypothetical protein
MEACMLGKGVVEWVGVLVGGCHSVLHLCIHVAVPLSCHRQGERLCDCSGGEPSDALTQQPTHTFSHAAAPLLTHPSAEPARRVP